MINNKPMIIPSKEGLVAHGKMFPSVITFLDSGKVLVGKDAKRLMCPDCTIANIKRKMGSDYKIKVGKKWYIPQELSALILKKIKKDAELYLPNNKKLCIFHAASTYWKTNNRINFDHITNELARETMKSYIC